MKEGTIDDIVLFLKPARWFHEQTKIAGTFNEECFCNAWRHLFNAGVGRLFHMEQDGEVTEAIGLVVSPSMFDGEMVATFCFWFVKDGDRGLGIGLMFNRVLGILNAMEIKRINVNALYGFHFEQTVTFLERAGFVAKEVFFQREIV